MARHLSREHDISVWDPMTADYCDPNFNSYARGPGLRLERNSLPGHPRLGMVNSVFKLFVNNIPPLLSEIGIRNVFQNYGTPLSVYKNSTWGLVSYASQREAELAIRKLHNTPPFYFKVQFARSPAEKERIRKQREDDEMLSRVLESEPYPAISERIPFAPFNRGIGRGRGVPLPRQIGIARPRPGRFEQVFHNDAYADGDLGYFSAHVPGAYDEINRMVMEQKINHTFNATTGNHLISMGRGYFPASEKPSLHSKHDIMIKRYGVAEKYALAQAVEQMYELWYECGQREGEADKFGKCSYCHRMASKRCQRCFAWYCTESCQRNDWPSHRPLCIPQPSATDASKLPGSKLNHAPTEITDVQERHKARLGTSDVHKANGQDIEGSADGFEHGYSITNSFVNKEKQRETNFKKNPSKQTYHNEPNWNTDRDKNRSGHHNAHFTDIRKVRNRSHNCNSVSQMEATEEKRSSMNERLWVARQKESGSNASLASDSTASNQIPQESEVSFCITSGQVTPSTGNMPNTAVLGKDSLSAKCDAIKDVTSDATVISAVDKMKSLSMSSTITVGCSKSEELPEGGFTKVKVVVIGGPMEYWVQRVDSQEKLLDVMRVLCALPESSPYEPEVGAMCAAFYDGFWFRGKVMSVRPELRVSYIDYGNEEVLTPDKVKGIPSSIMDVPALALRIKLAEGTPDQYSMLTENEVIPVKPVGKSSSGAVLVHVEGVQYKPAAAPLEKTLLHANLVPQKLDAVKQTDVRTSMSNTALKNSPQPKQKLELVKEHTHRSAVHGLKVGMQGGGKFMEQLIGGDCSVTIVCAELEESKLLEDLQQACESVPADEKYMPNIGDMVAAPQSAEEGDTWNRAHVLSVGNSGCCRVSFCDLGCTGTVRVVKKLPQNLASIPELAARCSVISCAKSMEELWSAENGQFSFTVTSVDNNQKTVTCVLQTTNLKTCKAVLKQWVPAVEDEGLKNVEVKNNDVVILQVFFDQKSLYVRLASNSYKDMFCQLNQDVGAHCVKALEMDHLPAKNEMVACKFEADSNYYRAKVLDVSKDTVKVVYVDFGNLGSATKDQLRPLPDSLKQIPCMAVKVGLKDALDKPITLGASDFLSDLVGREVEMKLIMTGTRRDEVQLMLPDGSSVNDRLNTLLEPEWKKAMMAGKDPRECGTFMEHAIKYLKLPVGQTIDFVVLHKLDPVTVMGCEANGKVMAYVHTAMTVDMNKYCNSSPEKSYVPRYCELCFAKFEDGVWYRAVYLGDGPSRDKNVVFLDFGNMAYVEKENIRKMIKDYAETPAVAVTCSLQGLENAGETVKKHVCELVQVNKLYKAQVVSCHERGSYVIEFPHVTEALIKKNLLPSEK